MAQKGRSLAWLLTAALPLLIAAPLRAQQSEAPAAFSPAETKAIEAIVKDYLVAHPEVLIEALQAYEARQRQISEKRQREAVVAHREMLASDDGSPVLGNPEGDVLIVEFFDYRCPYCRTVAPRVMDTVRSDGGIRLVMKEFPILGPDSVYAARAALAAEKQDKYEDFHFALMQVDGELDEKAVLSVAQDMNLDLDRLQKDMLSKDIDAALQRNFALAEALGIGGTPAFVIGEELVPGAIDLEGLRSLVAAARAKAS